MEKMDIINSIEEESKVKLTWFYHSAFYNHENYKNILQEGIKCNFLLGKSSVGKYNGPYYISLSKMTIPDNNCFLKYNCGNNPTFIIDGINPIECESIEEYEKYIETKDKRRTCNLPGEYQDYYQIDSDKIIGILYNFYYYMSTKNPDKEKYYIKELRDLINLLNDLDKDIPIYDYSRRDTNNVHIINKTKFLSLQI